MRLDKFWGSFLKLPSVILWPSVFLVCPPSPPVFCLGKMLRRPRGRPFSSFSLKAPPACLFAAPQPVGKNKEQLFAIGSPSCGGGGCWDPQSWNHDLREGSDVFAFAMAPFTPQISWVLTGEAGGHGVTSRVFPPSVTDAPPPLPAERGRQPRSLPGTLPQPQEGVGQREPPPPSMWVFPRAALGAGRTKGSEKQQHGQRCLAHQEQVGQPCPPLHFQFPCRLQKTHLKLPTTADQSSPLPRCWPPMHSLDEPLDLKLSVSKLRAVRDKRDWALGSTKGRTLCQITEDEGYLAAGPGSPHSPPDSLQPHSQCQDKRDYPFSSPPTVDLSLSPSPPGRDSPSGSTSVSPDRQSGGELVNCSSLRDLQSLRYIDSLRSSFQFFLPLNSGGSLHLPASAFLAPSKEKRLSSEAAVQKQLVCRWTKCNQLFDLLQDLVDHVNDFHVKPEKDAGYCCHWEGCARHGRGFNARYKMLIHIRTHTNEKPHRCPTCSKSFSRLENLKIHNRSHTGEKPYLCPYEGCSKRYSNSSDRFKHTRTHYVDKPYYCKMPGCHKRYTDPSSLRKHIKAHGHFITHEQQELLKLQPPTKSPLTADGPYLGSGAQVIVPTPAALFGTHSLPLPLPQAPLDLSTLACGGLGTAAIAGLPSPVLAPLNLAKNPLLASPFSAGSLGLPVVSLLAGTSAKATAERGQGSSPRPTKGGSGGGGSSRSPGLQRCKEASERMELARLRTTTDSLSLLPGGVLDLSAGMNSAGTAEALPPGWVVIPAGSVFLKQAVVN
ncbi:zinc finger protein GLIS2 isoform X2 [Python bivittatus]|uniref:Zinc finger protein GLIS2 n=1 Tax=Python bivittatus TaxID=176946 RepID=A0A9F2R4K4_PYTBI|nr:zinc finger protein GLIS2 isoform X2 [Python bivittatus]